MVAKRINLNRPRLEVGPDEPIPIEDTSSFDDIDPQLIAAMFEKHYRTITPDLLQLLTSQLAYEKAMENAEEALGNITEVELNTDQTARTVEAAYTAAFRYYVIDVSLKNLISDDVRRHETVLKFMDSNYGKSTGGHSMTDVLNRLKRQTQAPPNENPYGVSVNSETFRKGFASQPTPPRPSPLQRPLPGYGQKSRHKRS